MIAAGESLRLQLDAAFEGFLYPNTATQSV